jgi:hypothetical protein
MIAVRVMVVLGLAACAKPAQPRYSFNPFARVATSSDKRYPAAPPTSEVRPWQVGQWAKYRYRSGDVVGVETLRIVAQDACGWWFELVFAGKHAARSWQFCVRAPSTSNDSRLFESLWAVIERRDQEVASVLDFRRISVDRTRFEWLVALVHAAWPGRYDEVAHEDVPTPAGHFAQAFKIASTSGGAATTRWSHPAVAIGGVIKELGPDHERVLLAHGGTLNAPSRSSPIVDAADRLVVAQQQLHAQNKRGGTWWGLHVGFDSLAAPSDASISPGFAGSHGMRITSMLDWVTAVGFASGGSYANDPALGEAMTFVTLGVRWYPLTRSHIESGLATTERRWLYLQADIGGALLERYGVDVESSVVGRGLVTGARVGIISLGGRDWTYSIELHDHLALFDSDEGFRHTFGLHVGVQLFFPSRR